MKQRIITGVIAGAAFIGLLFLGGYWFAGLVFLLAFIGYDEYLKMIGMRSSRSAWILGLLAIVLVTAPWNDQIWVYRIPVHGWLWLLMLALFTVTVATKNRITIDQIALLFIGIVYIGFGFHYMIQTRELSPFGLYWTFLIFVCIWASDSGAYFSGYLFGKHLLWPSISPKKTVEGSIGGVVLSVVVACVFAWARPELLDYAHAVLLGVVIAVIGQIGDLLQSAYKRVKGIKDTGAILPGHGGVLDRVDSWLIVFPFIHLLSLIPS